jgi:HSP20 family protein
VNRAEIARSGRSLDPSRTAAGSSPTTPHLPGVDPSAVELHVEHNLRTVKVKRQPTAEHADTVVAVERAHGVFSRQLFLGEALDVEHITASYDAGVLTLKIPVAAETKPRKIEIKAGGAKQLTS